jgi:hypothetical protein
VSPEPSQPSCALCGAPLTDQGYICHPDTAKLATDLDATPGVLADLDITLTRQAVMNAGGGKGNGDKPLPYHDAASTVAGQIRAVLFGWVKVLLEEMDPDDVDDTDYAIAGRAPALWLKQRLADIRMREWAGDLARELRNGLDAADTCVDRHEERLYAGPCGEPPDGCPTLLWAPLDAEHITCRTCGSQWSVEERRADLIASAKGKYLDAPAAASLLSLMTRQRITAAIVETLAQDRHIHADELTMAVTGRRTYRIKDVLAALRYADDHKPATASEVVTWLREVYDVTVTRAAVLKWAQRYPDRIHRFDDGRYRRLDVLAVARPAIPVQRTDEAA